MPTKPVLKKTLVPLSFHLSAKAQSSVAAIALTALDQRNNFAPLEPLRSGIEGRESDKPSFGSVRDEVSNTLRSKCNRGRKPIPFIPEMLHLVDRLEPDKGTQARLFTDQLT